MPPDTACESACCDEIAVARRVCCNTSPDQPLCVRYGRLIFALLILFTGCEKKTNTSSANTLLEDVAMSPNSRYVIAWTDVDTPTGWCMSQGTTTVAGPFACRLYVRAYDQLGSPVTGEMLVSPTTNGLYGDIAVAIIDSGSFVIVYDRWVCSTVFGST